VAPQRVTVRAAAGRVNVPGQQPLAWSGVALVPLGSPQELARTQGAAWTTRIQQCEAPTDATERVSYGVGPLTTGPRASAEYQTRLGQGREILCFTRVVPLACCSRAQASLGASQRMPAGNGRQKLEALWWQSLGCLSGPHGALTFLIVALQKSCMHVAQQMGMTQD